MRIAGILQPGTTLGYVVESKYVKAGLIVVQNDRRKRCFS